MRRLVIVVEYLGTAYQGWQAQSHKNTISDVLTKAISEVLNQSVKLFVSGRTDLGVHALRQYAHFDTDNEIKCFKLREGVNTKLPRDIAIKECFDTTDDFDARKSVVSKTYLYKLYVSQTHSPLRHLTHAQVFFRPDVEKMRLAAAYIIGEHDFSCFMAKGNHTKSPVRTIFSISINQTEDEIHFEFVGNGFLYNMVRIMVGTLLNVGFNKIKPQAMEGILLSKSRAKSGKTMCPQGLYLKSVSYPEKYGKI